ncbi:ribokinase [Actinobacteria bacterium YIM 96077]|uniref:Ribokinase n=1 Tax=Phytoactinopolyspora halophila TaxID=1981511 RepID=A0A329QU35_9ACTN|nr:ribokinase [Phytoactinopolyspora halophila]AYY13896.1 ribokinase [Actinobacteria bacterium YIM 96077]RAW15561.1 ribokinase [Phytoactinopolyspora halophila]
MGQRTAVAVAGSLNLDVVMPVPHHPRPGETVLGGDHTRHPGGKGANQAVAAARLGQHVTMLGRVGDDDAGSFLTGMLDSAGVDTSAVTVTPQTPTGMAYIAVDEAGENTIIVSPGANGMFSAGDVASSAAVLADADVTLLQLEVPLDTVEAAARAAGGTVVLNPAPARELRPALLDAVDVLVLNETELEVLAGQQLPSGNLDGIVDLSRRINGPDAIVVTLGARGALLVDSEGVSYVPAVEVDVVDTTAAGDAFCGALADALVRREGLGAAVRWATRAAAVTVTRDGAQPALPSRDDVENVR